MAWAYEQIAATDDAATSASVAATESLEDDAKADRKGETAEWQDAQMVEDMTRRERRVLRLMAAGKGLKEICANLGVSRETANRLRQSVRRKLSNNLAREGEQISARL
jgi:DNA-binding NarL/FixJ family response regulator